MTFFNLRLPFFRPMWRRVATFLVAAGWAIVELISNSPGWALMFGAAAAYTAYEFFIIYDPTNYENQDNG
mgnify:FL=1|jgi:hypothetical protein